jgi:hypothetical protein
MLNYLLFETFYFRRKILMLYFLITFSRRKLTDLLWTLLVSVYPLSELDISPPLTSVMSQHLPVTVAERAKYVLSSLARKPGY